MIEVRFISCVSIIDRDAAASLEDSFVRLSALLVNKRIPQEERLKIVAQIDGYISKKCKDMERAGAGSSRMDLRRARNELAHGKSTSISDFSYLHPKLWRAVGRLGTKLGGQELENLLAYHLSVPNLKISSRSEDVAKVVKAYKGVFESFSPSDRRFLFRNILLGLFTDAASVELLEG